MKGKHCFPIVGLIVIVLAQIACGTLFTPPATPTPTVPPPTSTPESYYGIDEPAFIQDIRMTCAGSTQTDTAQVTVLDILQPESITTGKDQVATPQAGFEFLRILTKIKVSFGCLDIAAIGRQLTMVCGGQESKVQFAGINIADGRLSGFTFTFEVASGSDIGRCYILLPDSKTIQLAPLVDQ
jgi:hypothetical protein